MPPSSRTSTRSTGRRLLGSIVCGPWTRGDEAVTNRAANSFHLKLDHEVAIRHPSLTAGTIHTNHYVFQERFVAYRFFTHLHPYVGELMRRLVRGSTKQLEAADTDYVTNSDGSWQMLADGKTPKPKLYEDRFQSDYAPTALP